MSHLVTIQKRVRDVTAVHAACRRLNLPLPQHGVGQVFSRQVEGLLLHLPAWKYPVVLDLTKGETHFDHFEGAWGDIKHLDAFFQAYEVEKAKLEARRRGMAVTEHRLEGGWIRVEIAA
jgi:hypothetical protein